MGKLLMILSMSLAALMLHAKAPSFDWNPVMDAIIQVESGGNPNAISGNSVGVMQITPILVEDCNQILQRKKSKKRYTLADRYSVKKSKEMFLLIQSHYNPMNNVEKAIRLWNGGANYNVRATNRYFRKVKNLMK
jgi:predicted NACHT family NTPase